MPINRDLNCLFVHIPKTGGTSVEKVLNMRNKQSIYGYTKTVSGIKYDAQHLTPKLLKKELPNFDDYFKFTIIRDTYSRILSEFIWVNRHNKTVTYSKFLKFLERYRKPRRSHQLSQIDYLEDCDYDFILEFENLSEDWDRLCEKLGIYRELPHHKKADYSEIKRTFLNNETRAIIYDLFDYEVEALND